MWALNMRTALLAYLAFSFTLCACWSCQRATAQTYRNILNRPFHTIGNGPQSVVVVDVAHPNDRNEVQQAIAQRIRQVMQTRAAAVAPEIAALRRLHAFPLNHQIPVVDMVVVRHNGQILLPQAPQVGRSVPANNKLTFVANTTGQYAFDVPTASALDNVVNNLLYPALVRRIGPPLWNGQVTILNKDDNPTKVSGIIGVTVVMNPDGSVDIDLPNFSTDQDKYLGLLQAMAQTFHGPLAIGYDAWEMGMARAAAVVVAQDLQGQFPTTQPIDPAADFYYTPYYDVLNQPALGNNTFLPPTKSNQTLTGLGGMLVPRLQMASTAWLKCFIQNPQFFINFNNAYYDAWQADHTVANNTVRLQQLASTAVGGTVEGQPFSTWFQQQYVLDTSVTPGPKEFLFVTPTLPDTTTPSDGAAIVVLYYNTTPTGDEIDLNSVCNPIFYDYSYTATLTLTGADQPINIVRGEGYTSPLFSGIAQAQRIEADFPVNSVNSRLYYPVHQFINGNGNPNEFLGVVVGSDNGTLSASFTGGNGTVVNTPVAQGAFGAVGGPAIPDNFTQVTLTFTPAGGGQPITYKRNVFQRKANMNTGLSNVSSLFILYAPSQTELLYHVFLAGPQMVSLPIQPLVPDLAQVFGLPPSQTLLAMWRQDAGGDNYLRYPSMPLYQPGYGFWTNFQGALNGTGQQNGVPILGVSTDVQASVSVGLEYGWNQIGDPFTQPLDLTADPTLGNTGGIEFQFQGQVANLAAAVANGWIATGVFGYNPNAGTYTDITGTLPANSPFQQNKLLPWQGYFILVKVTEGITLTYVNPNLSTRGVRLKLPIGTRALHVSPRPQEGWRLPLSLVSDDGRATIATLGQAPQGADAYVPALDAASPPPFISGNSLSLFFAHPEWNAGRVAGTNFLSDIRPLNRSTSWVLTANLPMGSHTYTLQWGNTAYLPRGLELTLTDLTTGSRVIMNGRAAYTFTTAPNEYTRQFRIDASPRSLLTPILTGLHVDLVPAGGRAVGLAAISYEASVAGTSSVQIRASNGQTVRHLLVGRAVSMGLNRVVWDLKDDRGRALPTGSYLVEVSLETADGRQTRSIVPCTIIR
jgi:hypothetical protein